MTGDSPVLITSSPPPAGQHAVIEPTASRSHHWAFSSSPSQRLPSPSTLLPPRSSIARCNSQPRSPPFSARHGFKTTATIYREQASPQVLDHEAAGTRPSPVRRLEQARRTQTVLEADVSALGREASAPVPSEPIISPEQQSGHTYGLKSRRASELGGHNGGSKSGSDADSAGVIHAQAISPQLDQLDGAKSGDIPAHVSANQVDADGQAADAKITTNSLGAVEISAAKKASRKGARKRFTKSVSIILNSDEPDETVVNTCSEPVAAPIRPSGWSALVDDGRHSLDAAGEQVRRPPENNSSGMIDDQAAVTGPAIRRRRSWTPAKNTVSVIDASGQPVAGGREPADPRCPDPQQSLAALISRYTNRDSEAKPELPQRGPGGESVKKRRRIMSEEKGAVASGESKLIKASEPAKEPKPAKNSKPEKKRRPKAVKGPKTITAIATLAFQPQAEAVSEPAVTSEFFASTNALAGPTTVASSSKKPSKPRAKSSDKPSKGKKAASSKTPKAKLPAPSTNEIFLLPPSQAKAHANKQEFIFGTSSQLAVEESPEFIKQIQHAIQDSETMSATQTVASPESKSCKKVASAPHGTFLSVPQTDRDLWCTAARDHQGTILGLEDKPTSHSQNVVQNRIELDPKTGPRDEPTTDHKVTVDIHDRATVEFPQSSSPFAQCALPLLNERPEAEPVLDLILEIDPDASERNPSPYSDSWMLLKSDDRADSPSISPTRSASYLSGPSPVPPVAAQSAISPSKSRVALQALDANISIVGSPSPFKARAAQQRSVSATVTKASPRQSSPTRARGRPKKSSPATSKAAVTATPRKRGRPPKSPAAASTLDQTAAVTSVQIPDRWSDFRDIDEISDSDTGPTTPSPPRRRRRRAVSASPGTRPLDLLRPDEKSTKSSATAVLPAMKPGDGHWPAIQKVLFPSISATIRSAPPSHDMRHPSWHEKILLYDPIVLEDLTAWLNERGVRFEMRRARAGAKVRGRKKRGGGKDEMTEGREMAGKEVSVEEIDGETGWEVSEEPLKPWMVQKWCEEKGVCCLWKEGLRGGVRVRY